MAFTFFKKKKRFNYFPIKTNKRVYGPVRPKTLNQILGVKTPLQTRFTPTKKVYGPVRPTKIKGYIKSSNRSSSRSYSSSRGTIKKPFNQIVKLKPKPKPISFKKGIVKAKKVYVNKSFKSDLLSGAKTFNIYNSKFKSNRTQPNTKRTQLNTNRTQLDTNIKKNTLKQLAILAGSKYAVAKFDFGIRHLEKLKRAFKGERLTITSNGYLMKLNNKGQSVKITKAEVKEVLNSPTSTTLNPLNFVTGPLNSAHNLAKFSRMSNKKVFLTQSANYIKNHPKEVLASTMKEAINNPFGFWGEMYVGGKVTEGALMSAKFGAKPILNSKLGTITTNKIKTTHKNIKTNLNKVKEVFKSDLTKLSEEINKLKQEKVNIKDRNNLKSKKLRGLLEQKKIIDSDIKDINKVLKLSSTQPTKQTLNQLTKIKGDFIKRGNIIKKNNTSKSKPKIKKEVVKKPIKKKEIKKEVVVIKPIIKKVVVPKIAKNPVQIQPKTLKSLSNLEISNLIKQVIKNPKQLKLLKNNIRKYRQQTVKIIVNKYNTDVFFKSSINLKEKSIGNLIKKSKSETEKKLISNKKIKKISNSKYDDLIALEKFKTKEARKALTNNFNDFLDYEKFIMRKPRPNLRNSKRGYLGSPIPLDNLGVIYRNTNTFIKNTNLRIKNNIKVKQLNKVKPLNKNVAHNSYYNKGKNKTLLESKLDSKFKTDLKTKLDTLNKVETRLKATYKHLSINKNLIKTSLRVALMTQIKTELKTILKLKTDLTTLNDKLKPDPNPKGKKKPNPNPKPKPKPRGKKRPKPPIKKPKPKKLPKIAPKKFKLPKLKPKPKLSFKSKIPKGKRLSFNIQYKEKGKIKTLKTNLPKNLALAKANKLIDNSLGRSLRLVIGGLTSNKDIRVGKNLKFRQRRTLYALEIVEKRKYGLDTKGEKKGLTLAKAIKRKKL